MKIAVDAFPLSVPRASGIPNYMRNLFREMLNIDSENEYYLYAKNPFDFAGAENTHMRFGGPPRPGQTTYGNTLWLFAKGVMRMKSDRYRSRIE